MATINVLNNDCFFQVFSWLSLSERCGVQRVKLQWKRVIDEMIVEEDRLELFMEKPALYGNPRGFPNAYYSADLENFFRTGMINDVVKAFFQKFVSTELTSTNKAKTGLVLDGIEHLTIAQSCELLKAQRRNGIKPLKLRANVFKQLLSIFPRLKSIRLHLVEVEHSDVGWFDFRTGVSNLESLDYSSAEDYNSVLNFFAKKCKNLKELKAEILQLNPIEGLENLEKLSCDVSDTGNIQAILRQHPKLTKVSFHLKSFDLDGNEPFDKFPGLFPDFHRMAFLKEVGVEYENPYRSGSLDYVGPVLALESLTLKRVWLSVGDMKCLVRTMPSLSKLSLLDFRFDRNFFADLEDDHAHFLDVITQIASLRKLFLESYISAPYDPGELVRMREGAELFPSRIIPSFLDFLKMPRLRRLACNLFNIDDCFQLFCVLAEANPKQWYAFKEFDNYFPPMKLSEDVRSRRPRNVRFF